MATDIIARGMAANAQAGGGVTEGTITNALGYKPVSETDVNNAINNSSHLKRVITTTLPDVSKADKDTIYMIKVTSAKGNDKYQEYMLIDGSLQMIGDTSTDLTDYAKISDVNNELDNKVDKVAGKGLSTNDYTNTEKSQVEKNKADISTLQSGKVDKVAGKGLSTNDYTTADKSQVAQNKTDILSLQNGKVDKETGKGLSTNDYTDTEKAYVANISYNNAGSHNAIYRGKYFGTSVTDEQYTAIANGTFEDLYIGDYWAINGITYRIAAFDYYLNTSDTNCTKHHIVIVPDTALYNAVMNDTNTTVGGYVGSKMHTEGLEQAKTTIKSAFDGHVLSHRLYLVNAVTDGHPSAGAWCDSEVDLMNEQMVYGGAIFMPITNGSAVYANYRVEKSQLPLFAHDPSRICNRATWWLRDVVSAPCFTLVYGGGFAGYGNASSSLGVRPAFCIC